MTENDEELLKTILEVRLSESAVDSVTSNTSTQKNEAFNRAALSVLPKDVNYSRNFPAKLHSKAYEINNTPRTAAEGRVATATNDPLSPRVSRYLEYVSRRNEKRKRRQKTQAAKAKRVANRSAMEFEYHKARSCTDRSNEEYIKGQLDNL